MKLLVNILFLVITVAYALPVKEMLSKASNTCVTDLEEAKIKKSNEEKGKEILSNTHMVPTTVNPVIITVKQININRSLLLQQVETPPPDCI